MRGAAEVLLLAGLAVLVTSQPVGMPRKIKRTHICNNPATRVSVHVDKAPSRQVCL
jgi:hypothetical protein